MRLATRCTWAYCGPEETMRARSARSVLAYSFVSQAEDGIRDYKVTGVQTCALPIYWLIVVAAGAAVWWSLTASAAGELQRLTGWLGVAVAAGCCAHCLGDALTEAGCPFLFPV